MTQLHETFMEELANIYDAEKQLLKVLPKIAQAASNESLIAGFETHLTETETHLQRLDQVYKIFSQRPRGQKLQSHKRPDRRSP